MGFLKTIGRGILYFIFLPFIVLFIVGAALWMIVKFLYLGVKYTVLFFKGEHVFKDTEEDKQAKAIIEMNKNLAQSMVAGTPIVGAQATQTNNTTTTNNTVNNIFVVGDNVNLESILAKNKELSNQPSQVIINNDVPEIDNENVVEIPMDDKDPLDPEITPHEEEVIDNGGDDDD